MSRRQSPFRRKKPKAPALTCQHCGGLKFNLSSQTAENGCVHSRADCAECHRFVKFVKNIRPAQVFTDTRQPTIRYPKTESEFEIQAYLWAELRRRHLDARGEVKDDSGKSRLDIVVFRDRIPALILEIKARSKDSIHQASGVAGTIVRNHVSSQQERYTQFKVPVIWVYGLAHAKQLLADIDAGLVPQLPKQ